MGCSSLKDLFIPSSVEKINPQTYYDGKTQGNLSGCNNLSSIVVDSKNKIFDSRDNCNAIIRTADNTILYGSNNTIIPHSVTSISTYAFYGQTKMESITIPSSVNYISTGVFSGCTSLTSINVDNKNNYYDSRENCNAIIETSTNTLISGCKTTVIPNSVTSISYSAFQGLSNLSSATIPSSITSIQNNAFNGCKLENIVTKSINVNVDAKAFSAATFQHATLYIPAGSWLDIVYESGWYQFNNIREMADETGKLLTSRAYMLMDAQTFDHVVYDGVNHELCIKKAEYQFDESNPNSSWQIMIKDGKYFLYNIGARRYATVLNDGNLALADSPVSLEMQNGNNGVVLGGNPQKQWNFIVNQNVETDMSTRNPESLANDDSCTIGIYNLSGNRIYQQKHGVNIIRMSDGTVKKLVVK